MLALRLVFPVLLEVAAPVPNGSPSAAVVAERIGRYMAVVRDELAAIGVELRTVEARGKCLQVEYENKGEQRDVFVLASVLMLTRPLSGDCENIQITGVRQTKRLFSLLVPVDAVERAFAADLSEDEKARAQQLVDRCLAAAGVRVGEALAAGQGAQPTSGAPEVEQGGPIVVGGTVGGLEPRAAPARAHIGSSPTQPPHHTEEVTVPGEPERLAEKAAPGEEQLQPGGEAQAPGGEVQRARPLLPEEERELARAIGEALRGAALENISVGIAPDGPWVISFENRTYRSDIAALGAALRALSDRLPLGEVIVQVMRDAVPLCTVRVNLADYVRLAAGLLPEEEMSRRWQVQSGAGTAYRPARVLWSGGASYGRVDISYRPLLQYEIGSEPDPFESDLWSLWQAESTLGRGWRSSLLAASRATSGRTSVLRKAVVSHTRWLGRRLLGTASIGKFRSDLYGVYGEAQLDLGADRLGVVGYTVGEEWFPGSGTQAYAYYEHEFGRLGLVARGGYGRFLESLRTGASLSLRRRFGESVVEAEVVRTTGGEEGVNFYLSVPFGPSRVSSPAAVRLRPAPHFLADYWSTPLARGDYLQGDHDLSSFRGELTSPYLRSHAGRLLRRAARAPKPWPVAPSFEGTSGLMRIPTADVAPEGTVAVGVAFIDRDHCKAKVRTSVAPLYGAIGFLPSLEIVGRLSILHDVEPPFPDWPYGMDRAFHLHYRVVKQSRWMPAMAVGMQDVQYGTRTTYIGKATYIVGTWQEGRWRFHLGAGTSRLADVFGGVEYDLGGHRVHLMAEYDGSYTNAGARAFLGDWGSLDVGVLGLSRLCGAVVLRKSLQ